MRPMRLEIEGFTAFRERTVVEFDGAELFVFCGPTGSGKSSLIDAMTFALYGSIPRYNDPPLVHPVVSQGLQEARVRFDFTIQDKPYTAVRVIRRQKRGDTWGAVTKEARLESGKKDLAASARELDEQVSKLFGLSFEQFTTCVVLPQGEFARFLHATPADRQSLLKELLRIYIYGEMRQRAWHRQSAAKQQLQLFEEQIAELVDATPQARRGAKERVKALALLRKRIEDIQGELEELEKEKKEKSGNLQAEEEKLTVLRKIKQPANVDSLVADLNRLRQMLKEKEKASELSEKTLTTAEAERQKQPDSEPIKEMIKLYQQQAEEQKYLEIARVASAKSDEGKKNAQAQLQLAKKELEKAEAKVKELSRKHLAYHLAEELDAGEPCPVCLRPLDSIPEHAVPDDLADAERAVDEAIARKDEAERLYKAAETRSITDTSKVQGLEERLDSLSKRLKGAKPLAELKVQLELIAAVAARVEQARKTANDSQRQEREANTQFRKGEERLKQAWSEFERTRDLVAGLQPPPANRDDLKLSWEKLVDWAREKEKKATQEVVRLTDEAQLIGDRITEKSGGLRRACAEADIEIENNESIRDEVVEAHARAEEELKQIEQSIEKRQVLMTKKDDANRKAKVSGALARHLSANAFERWLLQEAFEQLVIGGSRKLLELSSGDYSFNLDERLNFDIVDHRNADEVRSSRTLSGGETFLASLALALTLAEQVADLATDGAARLESIFLDEGFGSLDPDTLEMVASTIEELGAKGRIVGLITHVRELADRIPVQYQVRKGPKTASVERIVL